MAGMPTPPLGMMPPFFPFLPFNIPPPRPPPNFSAMTEDEVRRMEGSERQHVEARVRVLRNIQTLLDAAVVQMNQYASVVASLDMTTSEASTSRTCPSSPPTTEQTQPTPSGETDATTNTEASASPTPPDTTTTTAAESTPSTSGNKDVATEAEGMAESSETSEKPEAVSPLTPEEDEQAEEIRRRRLERFS
ncbi:E3 ubiquitin-protein ligase synoviolin B [Chionoecetes opilio]|uniref:E3 ubiquitin-protein ligase synoviolin B n=1 Tax=Chionoecetes opilio TaxID=41210 RepID=A0A8J4YLE5_CHIOP|nr:E3 ubiquitin-protein ligase synoviolin B [Chionoecetes opilio]